MERGWCMGQGGGQAHGAWVVHGAWVRGGGHGAWVRAGGQSDDAGRRTSLSVSASTTPQREDKGLDVLVTNATLKRRM